MSCLGVKDSVDVGWGWGSPPYSEAEGSYLAQENTAALPHLPQPCTTLVCVLTGHRCPVW